MMDTAQFPTIPNETDQILGAKQKKLAENADTDAGVVEIALLDIRPGLDWTYSMRREMQEITPGLFLGPYAAAMKSKLKSLQDQGITHIVCIRQSIEAHFVRPNFPEHFKYLVLDIADSVTENIIHQFPKVRNFIDGCLQSGGRVLVHGNAGISRSGALVIAYVMEKFGLTYKDAYVYVQQRRFCVNPNEGFAQQLIEYEPMYRAKLNVLNGQTSANTCGLKRKCPYEREETLEVS